MIGLFEKNRRSGFVIPDNPRILSDIYIPQGKEKGAVSGHKVVVRLDSYGGKEKSPEGHVTEILGHINDPGVDILSIVRAYGLSETYPKEVMDEAEKIPEELTKVEIQKELDNWRMDLRQVPMVTIDGEDAKDLDDAVSISREFVNGEPVYHLVVHIADVSHYVTEKSALDREAYQRGTSVYLVDRVLPMLPHRLSNGICSLNAGCDRLALSCLMEIDRKGNVTGYQICESVIRVEKRMSYPAVNKILTGGETPEGYEPFVPMLMLLNEAAGHLREKRMARGAVDFDFPECKIVLDEKGRPKEIKPYERNAATMLIEDCMLAANETVAEDAYWQQLPFLYRSHEKPDGEKIRRFAIFVNNFVSIFHQKNYCSQYFWYKALIFFFLNVLSTPLILTCSNTSVIKDLIFSFDGNVSFSRFQY